MFLFHDWNNIKEQKYLGPYLLKSCNVISKRMLFDTKCHLFLAFLMLTGIYSTNCNIERESTIITSDYQSINRKTRTIWKHGILPGKNVQF